MATPNFGNLFKGVGAGPAAGGMWPGSAPTMGATGADFGMPTNIPAAQPGFAGGGSYIDSLYGSIGKTGNMIDAEGRDYWTSALGDGSKTAQDFYDSAGVTYGNALQNNFQNGYGAENREGIQNLLGGPLSAPGMSTQPNFATGGYSPTTPTNPYLSGMADDITRRSTDMMNSGIKSARGDAIMAGGFGGSGQGILEGKAIQGANDALTGNLAGLYGRSFEGDSSRGLQRYGMDQGAFLGNQGQQLNFYGQQRGQDLEAARTGAALYGTGTQSQWDPINSANGVASPWGSIGTTSTSGTQGGGAQGLLGGALSGAALGQQMGWWGNGNTYGGAGITGGGGFGTGSAWGNADYGSYF